MGSGVGATAAMVEAVDRDRVDGDIGPGETFQAPPQRSRPTPAKGDKWRTEHPTHVASPIRVTAGSPGAGPLRCPVWRQSRRRSQMPGVTPRTAQPSPHFSHSEINALPLNGQQAVTAITALWLWRSTAFRWLQQPIGRHLMSDVVEQVIQRHPEVKNEGIPEHAANKQSARSLEGSSLTNINQGF